MMTSPEMEDLLMILKNVSIRADARLQGWEFLLGLVSANDGLRQILLFKKFIPFLLSYIDQEVEYETIRHAHKCLINISSSPDGATDLLCSEPDLVLHLLQSICNAECQFIAERCYIVSNLSTNCDLVKHSSILSSLKDLLNDLMKGFCSPQSELREKYKFLAIFFANISSQSEGRGLLLENEDFIHKFILCASPEEPDVRRLGVALTLRNCCCEKDFHQKLLEEVGILTSLLLPLMGPEEFDEEDMEKLPIDCQYLDSTKEREKVPQIRKALVQALSLLCYSEVGWNYLKSKGVYYAARELHKWEKDESVNEAIETLVGFLLVLNYSEENEEKLRISVLPSETDRLSDIPNFII